MVSFSEQDKSIESKVISKATTAEDVEIMKQASIYVILLTKSAMDAPEQFSTESKKTIVTCTVCIC